MQRPVGEASSPNYRHGPPGPVPPLPGPRRIASGRPYPSSPSVQGRNPIMPTHPPFSPGGQQSHRFGPQSAPPIVAPPPPGMLTTSSASVSHPSMPPPPQMVPASGMIPPGQQHLLPPVAGSPTPLPRNSCPPPHFPQGLTLPVHTAPALPAEPPKPKDDEVIRNIEVLTQFVVKNGSEFESMAQAKQASNPKFSFLFGGEPGSDAAIGQEYYQWFKMKCQLERSAGREVEAKFQPAVPSKSDGFNQHTKDSNAVSSEGPLPASDASDMEMDMDMEDDIAVAKRVNDDGKAFETTNRKEGEHHLTVSDPKAECRETIDCQVTSLVAAGGKLFEASQLEFQKEKERIRDTALELPCVEDVSPIRPMPKEMQQNLTIEKSEVKRFSTVCDPPVASTAVAKSERTGSSHVGGLGSRIFGFPDYKSVEDLSPVRPMPKEMQENFTIEKSQAKRFSTVCDPPVASTAVAKSKRTGSSHVGELGSRIFGFPDYKSVEDASPVRPMPKDMQKKFTIEKSEAKRFSTVCDPPVASTAVAKSKCTGSSHAGELGSEIFGFPEYKSVQAISHEDMEYKKLEGVRHCYNSKSVTDRLFSKHSRDKFDSTNHSISLDQDNVKSNISLETDSVKPNVALVSDNLRSEVGRHGKLEELPRKVDKYGRVIRKSGSDSESNDTKEVRDPSWSRSPSPRYERRRKRSDSNSSRRKSRWSRSHSRSPKRRRSRSRTPLHDFRRGGDLRYDRISRRRGTPPLCNDFAKGRCYRGASCRFLHEEIAGDNVSRWSGGRSVEGRSDSRQDTTMSVGAKDGHFFGELDKPKSISPARYFDGHDNRNLGERRNQDCEGHKSRNCGERKNQEFDVHDNLDAVERKSHDVYDNHNFGERKNLDDEYDKYNFGERKNQEYYRCSDQSNNPCFNFLKGRCYRGATCKYLHSETTTDNCGRGYGVGKGRERMENRQDITKSYGERDNFEAGEMEKPKINSPNRLSDEHYKHNIRDKRIQEVDRTHGRSVPQCIFFARGVCQRGSACRFLHEDVSGDNVGSRDRGRSKSRVDVQDIPDLVRQRSQESQKHNDSSADTVMNPQFVSPCREKLQPHRGELWASSLTTVEAPPQHNHKGNLEHLPSREGLNSKPVLEGNVGQPLVSEGSTAESFKQKLDPDDLVESSHLHSNVNSHLTPNHFLPKDLYSLQNHALLDHSLMSRQVHGSGGLSLGNNDALRGTSPSKLNTEDKADLLPRGSPTNSSTMYQHSGITACSMPYERDSVAVLPSFVPQPVSEHTKYLEVKHTATTSTDMVTDCAEKKSPLLQTTLEPVLHFTGIREEHPAPMSTTMLLIPMQNKSGQTVSAPLVENSANAFGKMATASIDQRIGYSHTSLESLSHVSNTEQDVVTQRLTTIPHFASQTNSGQSASTFGEQKTASISNCAGPSTPSLSAIYQPIQDMLARGELNNHLSASIEHSSTSKDLLNKVSDSANVQDIKEIAEPDKSSLQNNACLVSKVNHVKPSSPSSSQNISGNEKNKDALESSLMDTVLHQSVHGDTHASSSMLENRSPACEGKNWNPGAGTEGAADIDTEQAHALDESKKSKEIKAIKQFRTVLAEFVKEELKPTWREGRMSKESFKTIVKKVVDKVAGSLQAHQIPRTQERIDQYIAASRPKLAKLIQGYVEKYVKS